MWQTPPRRQRPGRSRSPAFDEPRRFRGVIKFLGDHYFYIESTEAKGIYGRDPYVKVPDKDELEDLHPGMLVDFSWAGKAAAKRGEVY